jgi:hypothetical protein
MRLIHARYNGSSRVPSNRVTTASWNPCVITLVSRAKVNKSSITASSPLPAWNPLSLRLSKPCFAFSEGRAEERVVGDGKGKGSFVSKTQAQLQTCFLFFSVHIFDYLFISTSSSATLPFSHTLEFAHLSFRIHERAKRNSRKPRNHRFFRKSISTHSAKNIPFSSCPNQPDIRSLGRQGDKVDHIFASAESFRSCRRLWTAFHFYHHVC